MKPKTIFDLVKETKERAEKDLPTIKKLAERDKKEILKTLKKK